MNLYIYLHLILLFFYSTCNGQVFEKVSFVCVGSTIEIEVPKIKDKSEFVFYEGKSEVFITEDDVIIEFYCAGNYGSHISNKKRYKVLLKSKNTSIGIDVETNKYWRKDKNLIYSNCKVEDTLKYNQIFNNKIIQ